MAPPTDSHQLHQPLVSSTSHFINKAIIMMGPCLSGGGGGWAGAEHVQYVYVNVCRENYFCNIQGLDDFPLIWIHICLSVVLSWSEDLRTVCALSFSTVLTNRHYYSAYTSATICKLSLVVRPSSRLNAGQLWFIHSFCHVQMIHGSTLSKPMQRACSLAHSL